MESSLDIRSYNGCIVGGILFYTIDHDFLCTTQNSGVMVGSKSNASGSDDNNFYDVLDEVLSMAYPMVHRV